MRRSLVTLICSVVILGCGETDSPNENDRVLYLFIGHPRTWNEDAEEIDPIVSQINLNAYDLLLLGGDITPDASGSRETMVYIDGVLNVSSPKTLWALGNHDDTNTDLVKEITGRSPYYVHSQDGVTFVVTYTNDDSSSFGEEQMGLIRNICDTISQSSHLVLIGHKLTYMHGDPALEPKIGEISNGPFGYQSEHMIQPNNFRSEVYPLLKSVQERGIEVICVAGDLGVRVRTFEHETEDGIVYLASGISSGDGQAQVLLFERDRKTRGLSWRFVNLNNPSLVHGIRAFL